MTNNTAKKRTTSLANVSNSDILSIILLHLCHQESGHHKARWMEFVHNIAYLLNIEQVSDIENYDRVVYPIHHDQEDWRCVEWNEEYDGC